MITNFKIFEADTNFKKYLIIRNYYDNNTIRGVLLLKVKYIGKNSITTETLYDYGINGSGANSIGLMYYQPEFRLTKKISYDNLSEIIFQNDNLDVTIDGMIEIYNRIAKAQKYNII